MKNLVKNQIKKEFKGIKKLPLSQDEFKMYASQLYAIDDIQTLFKNQRRASTSNAIIRNDALWSEICELRKTENSIKGNKVKIAKLIKKALFNQLHDKYTDLKLNNVEDFVNKIANEQYENDRSAQVFEVFEQDRLKDIKKYMEKNLTIYPWCLKVKGLGIKLTGKLLAGIGDIQRFENPSKLWTYCGIGDASAQKMKKGVQGNFSPKMRSLMYLIGESFIKSNSQYKKIYDERKHKTLTTHPEWHNLNADGTPNEGKNMHPKHAHTDARRVMVKRFLAELYDAWYKSLGIEPPAQPYGVEIKGHHKEKQIVEY